MKSTGKLEQIGLSSAITALLISVVWGGNVVALKAGLATVPPLWSAFWRFASGAAAVVTWAKLSGYRLRPLPGESPRLLTLGLMFTAQITALNLGTDLTSPAYAVVLLNSNPIFTNIIGHFLVAEDRLSWQRIAGLAIAFAGICYLAMGRPDERLAPDPIIGNLIIMGSAVVLSARIVYTQRLVQTMDPIRPVVWQMVFSLPLFLGMALWREPMILQPLTATPVLAILYQGVLVAGFCFVIWTRLLKRHAPGSLSVFGFSVPVFGVILSAALFDEAITGRVMVAMAAVAAGILIVTRHRWPETVSAPVEEEQPAEEVLR